jgi:hypothetical protein
MQAVKTLCVAWKTGTKKTGDLAGWRWLEGFLPSCYTQTVALEENAKLQTGINDVVFSVIMKR